MLIPVLIESIEDPDKSVLMVEHDNADWETILKIAANKVIMDYDNAGCEFNDNGEPLKLGEIKGQHTPWWSVDLLNNQGEPIEKLSIITMWNGETLFIT